MNPETRSLARVVIAEDKVEFSADLVDRLMGKKAEPRFHFIQENAAFRAGRSGYLTAFPHYGNTFQIRPLRVLSSY